MKLHMHPVSTTSRPVMLFVAENDIDVELVVVDLMAGEHYQEPFTKLNPSRQVPVLEDGDFVLTESAAILRYLAEKIGSPAYPSDLRQRTRVNEAMDWINTCFAREHDYHLVYPQIFPHHAREPEDANKVTVEWGKTQATNLLGVFNDHWLGGGKAYLCGGEITIADYLAVSHVTLGRTIGCDLGKYANIGPWVDKMMALSSWGSVFEVFDGFAASLKDKPFITIS